MKFSNEELVEIAEDTVSSLELALSELEGVDEFKEIYKDIQETIDQLKSEAEPYEEELQKQWEQEDEDQNSEYERSVI